MLKVHWRTGVGYGDFVTGLGYAHTTSLKYQTPVELTFYWDHSKDFKFSEDDPETIIERCEYVQTTMRTNPMVDVRHVYNKRLEYRFLNQFDEFNPLHGLWYTNLPLTTSKEVVLWTSRFNKSFPGRSKDPAYKEWDRIVDKLEQNGYSVFEVTYRTPVKQVIEKIQSCAFGVGYDGLVHQIFKYMWKPCIVFCERIKLNKLLIPQASLISKPDDFLFSNIDTFVEDSKQKITTIREQHQRYINEHAIAHEHRFYNTPIY